MRKSTTLAVAATGAMRHSEGSRDRQGSRMSHLDRPATTQDVVWIYRALLEREPESEAVVENMAGAPLGELILSFLGSEERARRRVGLLNERYRKAWPGGMVDIRASPENLKALFDTASRMLDGLSRLGMLGLLLAVPAAITWAIRRVSGRKTSSG